MKERQVCVNEEVCERRSPSPSLRHCVQGQA